MMMMKVMKIQKMNVLPKKMIHRKNVIVQAKKKTTNID